jgi:maltose alpha-D-glucosyltransferase/alpha-amylase
VFARFGPEKSLQLYGRGLRRRLPAMLEGDERALRMAYSLMFSLAGTPVLFYGEEIGMAENPEVEGRYAVRTPMQWSADGGFSTASQLRRPMVSGPFGPERVNVAAQRRDPHSLLNWFERLIRRRRECPEIGFGEMTILDLDTDAVFAHRCDWGDATIVAVHELAGRPATVSLPVGDGESLVDLFGADEHALPATLELDPYAAHWYRVRRPGLRLPP